jgi:hypothetical protein
MLHNYIAQVCLFLLPNLPNIFFITTIFIYFGCRPIWSRRRTPLLVAFKPRRANYRSARRLAVRAADDLRGQPVTGMTFIVRHIRNHISANSDTETVRHCYAFENTKLEERCEERHMVGPH